MALLISDDVQRCLPTDSLTWIYRRVLISQPLHTDVLWKKQIMAIFSILPVSQNEWKHVVPKIENLAFSSKFISLHKMNVNIPGFVSPLCFRTHFGEPIWDVGQLSLVFQVIYQWKVKIMLMWSNALIFCKNFFWPDFSLSQPVTSCGEKQTFLTSPLPL